MTSPLPASDKLARRLAELEGRLKRLEAGRSASQLSHSSVDDGTILVKDENGTVRQRIGKQPDGSYGAIDENGPPPPKPTGPITESFGEAVRVIWNGEFAEDAPRPRDFRYVEVYAGHLPTFADAEKRMVILDTDHDGGEVVLSTTYDIYIWLVAVSTSGARSEPSDAALGEPGDLVGGVGPGDITEVEIADDAITAPKIRASAVEAGKIAANAVEAGNIQAGAITAAKLAAEIVLSSKLTAGTPSGARVDIDQSGVRQYDDTNQLLTNIGVGQNEDGSDNQIQVVSGTTGSRVWVGPGAGIFADSYDGGAIELDADEWFPVFRFYSRDRQKYGFINLANDYNADPSQAWLGLNGSINPLANRGNIDGYSRIVLLEGAVLAQVVNENQEAIGGNLVLLDDRASLFNYPTPGATWETGYIDIRDEDLDIGTLHTDGTFGSRIRQWQDGVMFLDVRNSTGQVLNRLTQNQTTWRIQQFNANGSNRSQIESEWLGSTPNDPYGILRIEDQYLIRNRAPWITYVIDHDQAGGTYKAGFEFKVGGSVTADKIEVVREPNSGRPIFRNPNSDLSFMFGNGRLYIGDAPGTPNVRRDLACRNIQRETETTVSTRAAKKDIDDIGFDALRAVLNAPAYSWRYSQEDETADKHIGPMAEDMPPEVVRVSDEGELSIEVDSVNAVLWEAVRKLAEYVGYDPVDLTTEVEAHLENKLRTAAERPVDTGTPPMGDELPQPPIESSTREEALGETKKAKRDVSE